MTAVSQSAKKKIKAGSFSLNRFGTGTQSVFHLVLAAFSLMCIICVQEMLTAFCNTVALFSFQTARSRHWVSVAYPAGRCRKL